MQKCIMIIAGEASGDLHGANLVKAMQKKEPSLFFCGIGGNALRDAGVKIILESSTLSVVGITEVISKIPEILKGISVTKDFLKIFRPDLLILIDFPDFNLHIAATAKKLNIPVLYYISPQIWAWRQNRVKKIAKLVDHIAVIFPFEEKFYQKHHVPVTFVGHPILDHQTLPIAPHSASRISQAPIIALLPGSRKGEISTHLPIMLKAANILSQQHPDIRFVISQASSVEKSFIQNILNSSLPIPNSQFSILKGTDEIFRICTLAIAVSGTVTLETALAGVPMIVIYKVSPVSYWIGKSLIKVKHISLVNLVAGKEIVPERIQDKASPENIADTVSEMLNNPSALEKMRNELISIRKILGGPGASEHVADIAIKMM